MEMMMGNDLGKERGGVLLDTALEETWLYVSTTNVGFGCAESSSTEDCTRCLELHPEEMQSIRRTPVLEPI
jgi:hypothetical protein